MRRCHLPHGRSTKGVLLKRVEMVVALVHQYIKTITVYEMHCKLVRMKYHENFHHEYQSSATIMKPIKNQFSFDSTHDKGVRV